MKHYAILTINVFYNIGLEGAFGGVGGVAIRVEERCGIDGEFRPLALDEAVEGGFCQEKNGEAVFAPTELQSTGKGLDPIVVGGGLAQKQDALAGLRAEEEAEAADLREDGYSLSIAAQAGGLRIFHMELRERAVNLGAQLKRRLVFRRPNGCSGSEQNN